MQTGPILQPKRVVQIIKSITAREIFKEYSEIKQELWGGKFWTSGYYINTVDQYGNEETIKRYVKDQGMEYQQIYWGQLTLFEGIS